MKLKDYFLSEEQVEYAKKTIVRLSDKKKNSEQETRRLADAQDLIKRYKWVRSSVAAAGIAIAASIAGTGIYKVVTRAQELNETSTLSESDSDQGKERLLVRLSDADKIKQTDKVISEAEQGMDNLQKVLAEKMASIKDPKQRERLTEPFKLAALNKANPNKNHKRFLDQQKGGKEIFRQKDINYFLYGVDDDKGEGFAATYIPPQRLMKLAPDFDKDNLLDALILYHEFQHVMRDAVVRSKLNTKEKYEAYNAFFYGSRKDKQRVSVLGEASAYAFEIEMFNLLLDGQLKDGTVKDEESVRKLLKGRDNQKGTVKLLLDLARAYYGSGSSLKGIKREYMKAVAAMYDPRVYKCIWGSIPYL